MRSDAMATKITGWRKDRARSAPTHVVGGRKAENGQEEWYVTTNTGQVTMVTSSTSAAAMDEAVELYSGALKRLAKR